MLTDVSTVRAEAYDDAKTDPGVVVLMPVFNGTRYLDAAISSILRQTYADFEFLIVDDGSEDDTLEMLHAWQKKDRRIRILSDRHQGLSAALNWGLSEARGDIIARMDADDISAPNRLEKQVEFLRNNPEITAVGSYIRFMGKDGTPGRVGKYPATHSAAVAQLNTGCVPMAHPAVAMRRRAVLSVGGYRSLFDGAEDFDLWLRLTQNHQIANLSEPLLDYRIHDDKVSVAKRWDQALAAYIAHFSSRARYYGHPDPTDQVAELGLHLIDQLKLSPAERKAVLTDLAAAALVSFEMQADHVYLRHARDCLFALNSLDTGRIRRTARTLIWHLWRAGERAQAMKLATWMARKRVPFAILKSGSPRPQISLYRARRQWRLERTKIDLLAHFKFEAQRCQHRSLGVLRQGNVAQMDAKIAKSAGCVNLVLVAIRRGIGDETDLGCIEADACERNGGRHVRILRIKPGRIVGGAFKDHRSLGHAVQVERGFSGRPEPRARRLAPGIENLVQSG